MNDEAARQGGPDTHFNAIEETVHEPRDEERAVFDLRIHVVGRDRLDVYRRVRELHRVARLFAPPGVDVRYTQLRDGRRSRRFRPTFWPERKRAA